MHNPRALTEDEQTSTHGRASTPLSQARARSAAAEHFERRLHEFRCDTPVFDGLVFIGDSLTEDFDFATLLPGQRIRNRGIASDCIDRPSGYGALHRLSPGLLAERPSGIVLLLGINDLAEGVSVSITAARMAALLDRLRERWPDTPLFLQSLTPARGNYEHLGPLIVQLNQRLRELASSCGAPLIDLHSALSDSAGRLRRMYSRDGLHLNGLGYQRWASVLATHFEWPQPSYADAAQSAVTRALRHRLQPAPRVMVEEEAPELALPDPAWPLSKTAERPVHELVSERIERQPQAAALIDSEGGMLSYGELGHAIDRVVKSLRARAVSRGDVVAIWAAYAPEMVWSVLGVLRSGAAFAVLDPAYPEARTKITLNKSQAKFLLVLEAAAPLPQAIEAAAREQGCQLVRVDATLDDTPLGSLPALHGDDRAYVAFTSGTTGTPRAILGTHAPITHFLRWHVRTFGFGPNDRFLMSSGLAHDPLLRDMFTPLVCGAALVVPTPSILREPATLRALIAEEKVSVLHLTPSFSELLAHAHRSDLAYKSLPDLRWAFFGGEILKPATLERFRTLSPHVTCVGFFGATETPQAVGHVLIAEQGMPVASVGRGIADTQLLVLDASRRRCNVGEVGEICVRTPYLSSGYLGDPELTAQRFVMNAATAQPSDLLYRTGDLGRYALDGTVECLGRSDRQVKIRGFRVELDEVEAALSKHPKVERVSVDIDDPASGQLVAYVVSRASLSIQELRAFVMERLPEYMVPSTMQVLDALPLTPNGKVDRNELARLRRTGLPLKAAASASDSGREGRLLRIWREVLGENVSANDNFFDLGGNSLRGLELLLRVEQEFGKRLPVHSLMQHANVASFAALLANGVETQVSSSLVAIRQAGSRPPVFWLPGGGGLSVMAFVGVSLRLGVNQPVYGLEADLNLETAPTTLREIAASYIAHIRSRQPHGPYHLFGFSLGSYMAYEIAVQLQAAGEQIGRLVVFDTQVPSARTGRRYVHALAQRVHFGARELVRSPDRRAALIGFGREYLAARMAERSRAPSEPTVFDVVIQRNVDALRAYASKPLPIFRGKVTCVLATDTTFAGVDPELDPRLDWRYSATDGVEAIRVPGNHLSMLEAPHVEELARALRACLRDA